MAIKEYAFYLRLHDWNFMSVGNTQIKEKRIIKKYIRIFWRKIILHLSIF